MQPRKRFLLYYDWENLIKDMSDSDVASLTRWIFKYQNTWEIWDMTYGARLAFSFMQPVFDEDRKDWEEISKKNSDNAKERWKKMNANISDNMRPHPTESDSMRASTDNGIDSVNGIGIENIDTDIPKGIWEQALDAKDKNIVSEEKKEYGNSDINKTLAFLTKHIWCDTFAESQKLQRQYAKHILNLWKEIWAEEMKYRIDKILEDKFKAKNSNKIAFIYKELKSFIHAPETEIFKC